MRPPILVFEGWDLHLYDSISDAELDLEAIDIEDGIYEIYDSEGRILEATTEGQTVRLVEAVTDHGSPPPLRGRLIEFLIRVDQRPDSEERLDRLIEMCYPYRFKPPESNWDVVKGLFRRNHD